jgi:tRNA (guanine-N7-)-methyltransferase
MRRTLKDYPQVSLKIEDLDGQIDFICLFGRPGPVHIEIGIGRATFLVNQAKAHPQLNFLGIEWANKYYRYSVDRIGRWNLTNVRIIRTDAAQFLTDYISDSSVDCFHVYFPDPWPKKRHHKRRFFNTANTNQLLRSLKPGGHLRIATDHAEYFEQIKNVIAANAERVDHVDFLPADGADTGEWVGTNFERKYLKENRTIFCLAVRKK